MRSHNLKCQVKRLSFALPFVLPFAASAEQPIPGVSAEAGTIIEQQILEGCSGSSGTIRPDAAIERDLTGDGEADLIVYHGGIWCTEGGQSGFCGQICLLLVYVREKGALVLNHEQMSAMLEVSDGVLPAIGLATAAGETYALRWDGTGFR